MKASGKASQVQRLFLAVAVAILGATLGARLFAYEPVALFDGKERFNPALMQVISLDAAEGQVRLRAGDHPTSLALAVATEAFLRDRFFHGYSYHSIADNWILALISLVRNDVMQKIDPDDILATGWAGCSQQAIVMQALLQRFGLEFATLGTGAPPHFTSLVKIDGRWLYIDTWDALGRLKTGPIPLDDLISAKADSAFTGDYAAKWLPIVHARNFIVKDVNRLPARHLRLLQSVTRWMSRYLWLVLVVANFPIFIRCKRASQPEIQDLASIMQGAE